MAREDFDLIIIGSGPGGYVAGIRAGQLGLKTALVEKDPKYGGTCTLRGCIPTKALLHTAAVLDEIREAASLGIQVGEPALDINTAQDRKQKVVDANSRGIAKEFMDDAREFPSTAFYDSSGELAYVHLGGYADEEQLTADIDRYAR